MTNIFSLPFHQALSDWQAESSAETARALKEVSATLPLRYRTCTQPCYRQISLRKKPLFSLVGQDLLTEKVSSWTRCPAVARDFNGGVQPKLFGLQGVILAVNPKMGTVILNLSALYQDALFLHSLEHHKDQIVGYDQGAGRYRNLEKEVVLEIDAVSTDDIYSLSGYSSSLEQLATMYFGHPPSDSEITIFQELAPGIQDRVGAAWLKPENTYGLLKRFRPKADEWNLQYHLQQ
ncbi:hypothetical protein LCGC14_0282470 [marine sediment metagenome]|uniref:Uncharacterized protein n=1 Tax=marine sediment metagenome TaxID=412755 RepID=A0A0F9X0Y9_9ZZZZ